MYIGQVVAAYENEGIWCGWPGIGRGWGHGVCVQDLSVVLPDSASFDCVPPLQTRSCSPTLCKYHLGGGGELSGSCKGLPSVRNCNEPVWVEKGQGAVFLIL